MENIHLDSRDKIISLLKIRGPSLPVQVSRAVGIETLFASAFLSELASDNTVKISNMKVGGSPLYFIPGQEKDLKKFYTYLPGKEREAFLLVKEKGVLKDIEQEPAIRVALRSLKDFAFPFIIENNNIKELYWKFFLLSEQEAREKLIKKETEIAETETPRIQLKEIKTEIKAQIISQVQKKEVELEIFDKQEAREMKEVKKEAKPKVKKPEFIEEIKSSLQSKNIQIINIEKSDRKEAVIRARQNSKEILIFAFNKKKIKDKEMIKAYKKALSFNLPYTILIREDISKKLRESIEASKSLLSIEKL